MPPKLPRRTTALLNESTQAVASMGSNNPIFQRSANAPRIVELDIEQVEPDPEQPRRHFETESLAALGQSIEAQGQLQPIIVRDLGERRYRIAAGERRWRARKHLGHKTIFAIISKAPAEEISLVENLHRADLGPFELALALQRLGQSHGYTQAQLGHLIGKSQADISKLLGYLNLPEDVLADHETAAELSRSVIYEISQVQDPDLQRKLWQAAQSGATAAQIKASVEKPRETDRYRDIGNGWDKVERGLKSMTRHLDGLDAKILSPEQKSALRELHKRLDEMLNRP